MKNITMDQRRALFIGILFLFSMTGNRFVFPEQNNSKKYAELEKKLEKEISLDLRDMDVVDVYKFLAVKGDFNISISKSISGRATLYLKRVSIKDALDIISLSNGLAYKIMSQNIIYAMTESEYSAMFGEKFSDKRKVKIVYLKYAKPAYVLEALKNLKSDIGRLVIDEDTGSLVMVDTSEKISEMEKSIVRMDHPLETHIYDLKYADAEDVANKLRVRLDNKAVGSVQADARSNQIVIQAFPERMKEVDKIVSALDKKTQAVLLEVRILKIVLNPEAQVDTGINWQLAFAKSKHASLRSLNFANAFANSNIGTTLGQIAIGDINVDNFTAALKALKQVSETKVLSNPSLMVLNNKQARIHIGDKLAYVTTTTIGTGESQRVNEEIHYVDTGVQFEVTPTINADGFVTMAVKPEISSKSSTVTTPQGSEVPLITTALVESNIIVKDGYTIIIGGLRQDELENKTSGIPGLMDVPVIGKFFSSRHKRKNRTEIVILITPHIVEGDESTFGNGLESPRKIRPDKIYKAVVDQGEDKKGDIREEKLTPAIKSNKQY